METICDLAVEALLKIGRYRKGMGVFIQTEIGGLTTAHLTALVDAGWLTRCAPTNMRKNSTYNVTDAGAEFIRTLVVYTNHIAATTSPPTHPK